MEIMNTPGYTQLYNLSASLLKKINVVKHKRTMLKKKIEILWYLNFFFYLFHSNQISTISFILTPQKSVFLKENQGVVQIAAHSLLGSYMMKRNFERIIKGPHTTLHLFHFIWQKFVIFRKRVLILHNYLYLMSNFNCPLSLIFKQILSPTFKYVKYLST